MRVPFALAVLLAAVVVVLVACDESESEPPLDAAPGTFSTMLTSVPDHPNFRQGATFVDLARVRDLAGVDTPEAADGEAAYSRALYEWGKEAGLPWWNPSMSSGDLYLGMMQGADFSGPSGSTSQYFGFGIRDVEGMVRAGRMPPEQFWMLTGDFDPEAVQPALETCTDCPEPRIEEVEGVTIYSWGDGLGQSIERRDSPPLFDMLGRGGSLAVMDDRVVRSFTDELARDAVRGATGGTSLASDDEWRETVALLDTYDLATIHVSDHVTTIDLKDSASAASDDPAAVEDAWATDGRFPVLDRYSLLASGMGIEDGEPYALIVLPFADAEIAEANVDRARQRVESIPSTLRNSPHWRDGFASFEFETRGRFLTMTARGRVLPQMILELEPIFLIDPDAP